MSEIFEAVVFARHEAIYSVIKIANKIASIDEKSIEAMTKTSIVVQRRSPSDETQNLKQPAAKEGKSVGRNGETEVKDAFPRNPIVWTHLVFCAVIPAQAVPKLRD